MLRQAGGKLHQMMIEKRHTSFEPHDYSTTSTWNFGDGSSLAHGSEVTHTWSVDGTYQVKLTEKSGEGTGKITIPITVRTDDAAVGSVAAPSSARVVATKTITVNAVAKNGYTETEEILLNIKKPGGHYALLREKTETFAGTLAVKFHHTFDEADVGTVHWKGVIKLVGVRGAVPTGCIDEGELAW